MALPTTSTSSTIAQVNEGKAKSGGAYSDEWEVDEEHCFVMPIFGGLAASGVVTNTTARRHDYFITVEFRRPDGVRIDRAIATVNEVLGGDTVEWSVEAGGPGWDGLQCPVTEVLAMVDGDANTPTTSTNYGQD